MDDPVTSSILFHCWTHEDVPKARSILESICNRGLLLTTNASTLDMFTVDRGQGPVPLEVMQHARVCFTDIPIKLLAAHGRRYGKYGIGFRREVVIEWGGLPAWYLPNYWSTDSLKVVGPVLVNALHAAMVSVDHLRAMAAEFAAKGVPLTIKYEHGPTLTTEQVVHEAKTTSDAIFMVLSFIKEMSPRSSEDHSYLFEREWRVVSGFGLNGQPSAFRPLTADEKKQLYTERPVWAEPRQSVDINITSRYGRQPVIDSFQIFNGLTDKATVAQQIDTILVPNDQEARWATSLVDEHRHLFGENKPKVLIFPDEAATSCPASRWWRRICRHRQ
jgi:Putative abortive phage resistance protein AbiGi, antitoxin